MALKEKEGRDIREAIERFVRNLVRREISTAPYNQTKNGQVTKVTPHGYTVLIENKEYPNMLAINCANLVEGDVVVCAIPNGQMSQSYIVGKKVGLIQVSAGGGAIDDVRVNNVSVVTNRVANIVADTTVANTTHLVTSGAVYTAISGLTSDISNIKNGQTINSFAGVESALDGKVSLTNNGSQTIATTGTSGDDKETPLFLKSNNSDAYIGFKDSSGTTLGYYGVDANNKPIFYDTSAKQIALTDDINDATLTIQLNGSSVGTFTANSSTNKTANIKALPNYSLNISTSAGNPREVRFVRINYSTFDGNNAAYFKIGAMCSHGNGKSYTFLEDIIIGCDMNGSCTCEVYKQVQNVSTYTVGGTTVHFGDVYWTVDTTNKIVDFYIICGQYATINFTPFTAIGATVKDTSKIYQYTGSATLYSSGTRIWANGNSTLYARLNDIPESAITATPSIILQRDASGNANAVAFNLCTSGESTMKASMQYNSTTEAIEFVFS